MRNLTTSLNPLNRLATLGGGGISAMRNFGRSASQTITPSVAATAPKDADSASLGAVADLTTVCCPPPDFLALLVHLN
jgi:hypothetical protein